MTDVVVLVTVVDEHHPRYGQSGAAPGQTLHRAAMEGPDGTFPAWFPDGFESLHFREVEILPEPRAG